MTAQTNCDYSAGAPVIDILSSSVDAYDIDKGMVSLRSSGVYLLIF